MSGDNGDTIIGEEKPKIKVVFQIEENEQGNLQFRNFSSDLGLISYSMRIAELAVNALIMQTEGANRQPKVAPMNAIPGHLIDQIRGGFRKKK